MRVSLFLALFSANSRLLMSFSRALYLFICSPMISSTHLRKKKKTDSVSAWGEDMITHVSTIVAMKGYIWWECSGGQLSDAVYIRSCFADVLHALQWVDSVRAAEDAGGKDDGKRIGRHAVGLFLQRDPRHKQNKSMPFKSTRPINWGAWKRGCS